MRYRLFVISVEVLFIAFSYVSVILGEDKVMPSLARYDAEITQLNNDIFFTKYKNKKIDELLITSSGGDVESAIYLARWVFENRLNVTVENYCLSSCANYIFPAANNKYIRPGAIVAWHGNYHHLHETGLWKSEIKLLMKKYQYDYQVAKKEVLSQVKRLVEMEKKFFKEINVDQFVCWIGKIPPYNVSDFYFLSKQDMQHFGIGNVSLPDDYRNTAVRTFPYDVVYLQLEKNH